MPTMIRSGRTEKRVSKAILVQLIAEGTPALRELTVTGNVSPQGARLRSRHPWKPDEYLSFECIGQDFRSRARVVYCERLLAEGFAVGLHFIEPVGE